MREDDTLEAWSAAFDPEDLPHRSPQGSEAVVSLSGHERNLAAWNQAGQDFVSISALSGLDSVADGRSFAYFDMERDGWSDIALANANAPALQLFHNEWPNQLPRSEANGVVALRFVGAGGAQGGGSPKLPCGTVALVELEDARVLRRTLRCGEGFAAQNSTTLLVGLGARDTVRRIRVRFPSGRQIWTPNAVEGQLLTFYEDATNSPTGFEVTWQTYRSMGSHTVRF